jgi:Na+-translocating ferredoxin:NAD+ oxidoreductase subunit A
MEPAMTELALIMVSAILVNNFVLVQFLGLCPFMGVSKKIETAIGLSLATTFVLTLAAMCSYLVQQYVLKPLDIEYLRTISFILVIAVVVQFTEMVVNKTSPLLYRVLGIFLPLITTNCAVLGVAILVQRNEYGFVTSVFYAFAAGMGFLLAMIVLAAIRERLEITHVPRAMKGTAIGLVSAGIMSLSFMAFRGMI